MPYLILYSRHNEESKLLRKAADGLKWKSFRSEGMRIPQSDLFEMPIAIYCTPPDAFQLAKKLHHKLLGCSAEWLPDLPFKYIKREIELLRLKEILDLKGRYFFKPALSKSFNSQVVNVPQILPIVKDLDGDLKIYISEPVEFTSEYRCFISNKEVKTLSPYKLGERIFKSYASPLISEGLEQEEAKSFATDIIKNIDCPKSFVLDVGFIKEKGWAVVEANECWASAPYACDLNKVLEVLQDACIPESDFTEVDSKWDYEKHFLDSSPHLK